MALRNTCRTLIANIISFVISAVVTFWVPKRLGLESYGYFQLYHFYVSYIGLLHLGWVDGIFLRYGGEYYDTLNKKRLGAQFWLFSGFELAIGALICIAGHSLAADGDRGLVFALTGISVVLYLPRTLLAYVLQCTNRIKECALLVIIEKVIYLLGVAAALLYGCTGFAPIVFAELTGQAAALIYAAGQCKEIVLCKPEALQPALKEAKENIAAGLKLMFANIASMLIIGIVRMAIENQWDVATFGKVSLTMSVSNLLMVFIRAVALVLFPLLRRTNSDKLTGIYHVMRTGMMIPLLGMLVLYSPMKAILSAWLPDYADSLKYMALLFPMCVFESKMSMLIETYMKTLRQEKRLLFVNVITVCLSVLLTGAAVYGLHNLDLAIVAIVVLLAFRCVIAELILSRSLKIRVWKDIAFELVLTAVFICSGWFIGGFSGLAMYVSAYVIYLIAKRQDVWMLISFMKKGLQRRN